MDKTILVLGAGVGGIVTARELRRHLGNQHRVVLVDRSKVHSFPPSYLWVMVGWRKSQAIQKPLSLMEKHGIEYRQAGIQAILPEEKRVETDRGTIRYDYLVVSLGAELTPQKVSGWSPGVHSFYSLDEAEKLRDVLTSFPGGSIAIIVGGLPYKCPPAPYEAAFILESYFSRRSPGAVKIAVFTLDSMPLPAVGPEGGEMLAGLLKRRGIDLHLSHRIMSINSAARRVSFENRSSHPYDLLICIPPHASPEVVRAARLADDSGWIPVEGRSLRTRFKNVFAIGDVTTIPLSSGGSLPKAGVFASAGGGSCCA